MDVFDHTTKDRKEMYYDKKLVLNLKNIVRNKLLMFVKSFKKLKEFRISKK